MKDQAYNLRKKMLQASTPQAKTIAVVSGKGGVGKSNISTSLSILLGQENQKVLLFDLDIGMGNIHILLGSHNNYSIMDYIENQEIDIDHIISENANGISYISGGNGLKSIVEWKKEQIERFFEAMDYLVIRYDYIVFDMGAGATKESLDFLLAMDEIIVVTTPEPTSITDAYSMIKYINLRNEKKEFHLLCNRAENHKEGNETITRLQETVKKFLSKEINVLGILPEDSTVKKAVTQQIPLVIGFPNSSISLSLRKVSQTLLTGETISADQVHQPSFLKNIRKLFFGR